MYLIVYISINIMIKLILIISQIMCMIIISVI